MKIFRIILLAIIAASGGHFVEALDHMCEKSDDCNGNCLWEFQFEIDDDTTSIDLRVHPYGVCEEDIDKLKGFALKKEQLYALHGFIYSCQSYQSIGDDMYEIVNKWLPLIDDV
eukprot:GHVS01101109.1.p1 GENE.GHVS01101109.1~~GHVS01101109.1.p1  ORF type:complete len:114 (+),score=7.72 GHVS01101109.1:739-1080(+)